MSAGTGGERSDERLVGRSYTRARRYPWVLGNFPTLGGEKPVRIPGGPYSMPQIVVFMFVVLVLSRSYRFWAHYGLASVVFAVVMVVVPTWAARHARVEGRPLHRAVLGAVSALSAPRHGRTGEGKYREPVPVLLRTSVHLPVDRARGTVAQLEPVKRPRSALDLFLSTTVTVRREQYGVDGEQR